MRARKKPADSSQPVGPALRLPELKGQAKLVDEAAQRFFKQLDDAEEHHDSGNKETLTLVESFRDYASKQPDSTLLALAQALVVLAHDQVIQTFHQRSILRLLARHEHLLLHALSETDPVKRARVEQAVKLELGDHALRVSELEQSVEDLSKTLGDMYSRLARPSGDSTRDEASK